MKSDKKIYSKLFEFSDPKSWVKNSDGMISEFYNNYKLKIYNSDLGWFYKIDKYYSTISSGLITLNFGGKILFSICGYVILIGLLTLFFKFYMWYLFTLPIIYALSYIAFSIWNYKIYIAFRKIKYNIDNAQKFKKIEEQEKKEQEILNLLNETMKKNPKFSRKNKLDKLNKLNKKLNN